MGARQPDGRTERSLFMAPFGTFGNESHQDRELAAREIRREEQTVSRGDRAKWNE